MSSYGAHAVNSGPLEIRLADQIGSGGGEVSTYLVQGTGYDQEVPVSSNRLLMTSANGLLQPTDRVRLSSLTTSTFLGSTVTFSTLSTSALFMSTTVGSTLQTTNIVFCTMYGSSILGNTLVVFSSLVTPALSTTNTYACTMIGRPSSEAYLSTLTVNQTIIAPYVNPQLSTVTVTNMTGTGQIKGTTTSSLATSTTNLALLSLTTSQISTGSIAVDTMALQTLSTTAASGDPLAVSVNALIDSTATCSTLQVGDLSYVNLTAQYVTLSTLSISTVAASTINASPITCSSLLGSSLVMSTIGISVFQASTLLGSSLQFSSLLASSLQVQQLTGSSLLISTMSMSSLVTGYLSVSTLTASSLTVGPVGISSATWSYLGANTVNASSLGGSSLTGTVLIGSTLQCSSMIASTVTGSTIAVNTITGSTLAGSMIAGTVAAYSATPSFTNVSSLGASSLSGSIAVSSLSLSSVNGLLMNTAANSIVLTSSVVSATATVALGYQTLANSASIANSVAIGNQALVNQTTGQTNLVIGTSTVITDGSFNVYVGYGAEASSPSAINEISIGGLGQGSNTAALGNLLTTKTQLFGSVGIGTTAPGAALDVRGRISQTGGNLVSRYSTISSANSIIFTADGSPMTMFLNDTARVDEGGAGCATLRNSGPLRLQSTITMSTTYMGIGTAISAWNVDVKGGIRATVDGIYSAADGSLVNGITVVSPTTTASLWMGYDPLQNMGYLNAGGAGLPLPIILQTHAGYVGIGKTNPSATLDIAGSAQIATLTVGTTISCLTATVAGSTLGAGSPWTGTIGGPLSYIGNVTVSTLTATTYQGLPSTTTAVAGMATTGTAMGLSGTVPSLALSYLCATCTNTSTADSAGYRVILTARYQNQITISPSHVISAATGTYQISIAGSAALTDTINVVNAANTIIATTQSMGPSISPISLTFQYRLLSSDTLRIYSQQTAASLANVYVTLYLVAT